MTDIRDYLKQNTLLFDGGMGTYFSRKNRAQGMGCEMAVLSHPELIADIHREYLTAGSRAIKTDTFAANRIRFQGDEQLVRRVIRGAWELARDVAADRDAWVFADIGPVCGLTESQSVFEEFRFLADCFLEQGAKHFLFETNANAEGLREIAEYIRAGEPEAFIITSFAVSADGFSGDGIFAADLFSTMRGCESADAVGLNCVCGARHMLELAGKLDHGGMTLSLMPNAGYPVVLGNRTFYEGDPAYFAEQMREMEAAGAAILGGCCGTLPIHIERAREALQTGSRAVSRKTSGSARPSFAVPGGRGAIRDMTDKAQAGRLRGGEAAESVFWNKLRRGERVFAVELDSPPDVDMAKFMKGAWELRGAGCDIITVADCPIARARMDSSLLACKIRRELDMDALPHMTCRDRNLNATKALLFGLYAEGVRNVLLVTGDPIPSAERDEVKSVYQFNSRKLAAFVTALGKTLLAGPFHLFGALNVNAKNFDAQLRLAREKVENGMVGFLTQPVLSHEAFENLCRARAELPAYILGGIMPVVSAKNARFMDSEVSGIRVDEKITELYGGKDRKEAEALAAEISVEVMRRLAPHVDGYYLMTPFGRTGLVAEILEQYGRF